MNRKGDFPALQSGQIYFDTAATAHKPQSVIDAIVRCYSKEYATVHRAIYRSAIEMTEHYHEVRCKVQRFIGAAHPEEIVFTKGTTEGINLVASSFGRTLQPGDEVVLSELEHHSNIVPWQIACADRGAHLRIIPADDRGVLDMSAYRTLLSKQTRMVAIGHISNALGTLHPIAEMVELAHQVGAKFLVDGAQAAPHLSIDVKQLGCDFYLFSGHKLYGPTGVGVLYGRRELLEGMAPYQGGGDMIESVTFEETRYNTLPTKFEAGTPPIAQVAGLGAAIDYLESIGLDEIGRWEQQLLARATERLLEIPGTRLVGTAPEKGAILTFAIEGCHPLDFGTLLDLSAISIRTGHLCAQPALRRYGLSAFARASFGLYNSLEEVDRFVDELARIVQRLV